MLPRPIPSLNEEQWAFIVRRLSKPAPESAQKRLRDAVENAKKIRIEPALSNSGKS